VDRSILGPAEFIRTNIEGTFQLLEAVRGYWSELPAEQRSAFRFLHVSTDEVYGSLTPTAPAFTEETPYAPNSPYSASKASSDHLVRAIITPTASLCSPPIAPTITAHASSRKVDSSGDSQCSEGLPLPVYGDGQNVRDWLYAEDHCDGICTVLERGIPGQTYNIGGRQEMSILR